jgi:hypothetical protein
MDWWALLVLGARSSWSIRSTSIRMVFWSSWFEAAAFDGERSLAFPLPLFLYWPERVEKVELAGEGFLFVSSGVVIVGCDELPTAGGAGAAFLGAMIVVKFVRWMWRSWSPELKNSGLKNPHASLIQESVVLVSVLLVDILNAFPGGRVSFR